MRRGHKQHKSLFSSNKWVIGLSFFVLLSHFTHTVISALDFSNEYVLVCSQESEKPKHNEGKNAFDFDEVKYIQKQLPLVTFPPGQLCYIFTKDETFLEVTHVLDSPPPELA